jgi:HTH-type transcriptional regulator/antitoxin HipB
MVTNVLLRTPIDLGSAIRDGRRRLNLDQSDLARQIGVSRKWIIDVEKGKPRAEIGLVLRALDALGLRLALDTAGENATPVIPVADIDKILDRTRDDRS